MTCYCQELAGDGLELSATCLGHLWIFRDLDPAAVAALNREAVRKKLTKGQTLFIQGDRADELFLLKGGRIKLSKVLEDGNELTLDLRQAGDFVGENMFAGEGRYPLSAICLEDCLICGFTRQQFERLILAFPQVGLQIIKNLSARIEWLTGRAGSLAVTNIEDRLYSILCSIAREHGRCGPRGATIAFPLTHEDLGFLTGAHRVSITRAMKALKNSGKVLSDGRNLILPLAKPA